MSAQTVTTAPPRDAIASYVASKVALMKSDIDATKLQYDMQQFEWCLVRRRLIAVGYNPEYNTFPPESENTQERRRLIFRQRELMRDMESNVHYMQSYERMWKFEELQEEQRLAREEARLKKEQGIVGGK